jgi:hypothetical protein
MTGIAGISLYSHQWNPYVDKPFTAIEDQYDVYILQVASSWGQIWNKVWWCDFISWLEGKDDEYLKTLLLPECVSNWSEKSWLKFYNGYLVDAKKYFIYPRQSLTTNFSDKGAHATENSTYQVPLLNSPNKQYHFPAGLQDVIRYDAYFENENLSDYLGVPISEVNVSLYGNRTSKQRYHLTTQLLDFMIVKSFALRLRPMDMNILYQIPGKNIFLYDTHIKQHHKRKLCFSVDQFMYEIKTTARFDLLVSGLLLYCHAILRKINRLL